MMECTHETILGVSLVTLKATTIEKTSWMMQHALHMLCCLDGKVRNVRPQRDSPHLSSETVLLTRCHLAH